MSDLHFTPAAPDWEAVSAALGDADTAIPEDVQGTIRRKAAELVQRARLAVLAEPTHGSKHTGLRADIAAGTNATDIPGGSDITSQLEGNRSNLPLDMDHGEWAHPLNYVRQHQWVTEGGFTPWFTDTMDEGELETEEAVNQVLNDALRKIQAS